MQNPYPENKSFVAINLKKSVSRGGAENAEKISSYSLEVATALEMEVIS